MGSNRLIEHAQSLPGGVKRENPRGRGNWEMKRFNQQNEKFTSNYPNDVFIVYKWISLIHLVMCEMAIVLQSISTKLFRDVATCPNLRPTTDHMFLAYSLDLVVFNHLDAGSSLN